jgi:hypothetical protein
MQLFKEHLGLFDTPSDDFNLHGYRNMRREDIIVMDPLHDEFYYDIWDRTAKKNTLVYRDVFHCVPDDTGKKIISFTATIL